MHKCKAAKDLPTSLHLKLKLQRPIKILAKKVDQFWASQKESRSTARSGSTLVIVGEVRGVSIVRAKYQHHIEEKYDMYLWSLEKKDQYSFY